ncbi:putative transcriptional regulator [Sphingomonas paucimobilis]|nr:putative transcriptional regulator [Sphingomonas paucimobilis]
MTRRERSADIDIAAADWAARLDRSMLTSAEQGDLNVWLAADSRRLGALARAQAMLVPLDAQAQDAAHLLAVPQPARFSRRALLGGGLSTAAMAAGGAWLFLRAAPERFTTRKGEVRLVPLADGSSMTLNTASHAEVLFDAHRRHVRLIDGEALFEVARERQRPFTVKSGDMQAEALGTVFSVANISSRPLTVTVKQGRVAMRHARSTATLALAANMQGTIDAQGQLASTDLAPGTIDRDIAWREGKIIFSGETLRSAAAEFARYSDVPIAFADAFTGNRTISGYYSATDVSGFVEAVSLSLGLRVAPRDGGYVLSAQTGMS